MVILLTISKHERDLGFVQCFIYFEDILTALRTQCDIALPFYLVQLLKCALIVKSRKPADSGELYSWELIVKA